MSLKLNTSIATPSGWKKLFEIKQGDFVFGYSGQPVEVVSSALLQGQPCFKIQIGDETFVTDGKHEWLVGTEPLVMSSQTLFDDSGHSIADRPVVSVTQTASVSLKTLRVDGGYYLAGRATLPAVGD